MLSIDEKLRILQPILGTEKVLGFRRYYYIKNDFRDKKRIENHIDLLISRYAKKGIEEEIILPPPDPERCKGDIAIGRVEYLGVKKSNFELKLKDINRHVGIFGSTGSGKTTFARNVIRKLHRRKIPFIVFDWEKSYRSLVRDMPDVRVFTVGTDINPLFINFLTVPPGIQYDEYIKSVIAVISEDYIGGIGADTMLLTYMEKAYDETKNPFFADLKEIIVREITKDMKGKGRLAGRSGLWKESVSRQITFMSKGSAGNIINTRNHYPLEELFQRPVVLEFGGIKSPHDRKFFIHIILNWLSIYNQYMGIQSENLRQAIIFEEFHNIAIQSKDDNMVSNLFRESRKYGIGLFALDQTPSEIPNSIFANMNVKVSFSLNTSRDISAMSKAMNLDMMKARYLGMLDTGKAIVNIKQRYNDSFLIQAEYIKIEENMADEELKEFMKPFTNEHTQNNTLNPNQGKSSSSQITDTITPTEKLVMSNVIEHPLLGIDKRTKLLGLHSSEMSQIHKSMEEKGIIRTATIDRKKLIELTDKGKEIAIDEGFQIDRRNSRGGIEHFYWTEQVCQYLGKLEFQPAKEMFNIDITDVRQGLAIEIETGKSDIKKNVLKLMSSRLTNCYMLSTTKIFEVKLKDIVDDTLRDMQTKKPEKEIKAMFIGDFLKLAKDKIISQNKQDLPQIHTIEIPPNQSL